MRIPRFLAGLSILLVLTACAPTSFDDASPEEVARAAYVSGDPPSLTLFTMVNNSTGAGGHSSLMVSGSQRVIFDPAGSFRHPDGVERGDVLYGMSPAWVAGYKSAHARSTYRVVSQTVQLTEAQAETALRLVQSNGPVASAFCANAVSSILRQVPGFEATQVTFYPVKLMDQFDQRPDVQRDVYYENDEGDVRDGLADL
ncbi:MAG: hypothetical protein V2I76_15305 [Roseobacter sp.]|nr:hypothetical protein [Roseobacter sp.]